MKKNELHPELLNIDRMKSKPFTKKDFQEISAFIKANKEKKHKQKTGKVKWMLSCWGVDLFRCWGVESSAILDATIFKTPAEILINKYFKNEKK